MNKVSKRLLAALHFVLGVCIIAVALFLLIGCGFVEQTYEENREEILQGVIEILEGEKENDRLLDEVIERLQERRAAVAPVGS